MLISPAKRETRRPRFSTVLSVSPAETPQTPYSRRLALMLSAMDLAPIIIFLISLVLNKNAGLIFNHAGKQVRMTSPPETQLSTAGEQGFKVGGCTHGRVGDYPTYTHREFSSIVIIIVAVNLKTPTGFQIPQSLRNAELQGFQVYYTCIVFGITRDICNLLEDPSPVPPSRLSH